MAYKSLLLTLVLTGILGYCFTVGLTSPNSLLKKTPDWITIPALVLIFFLYFLAAWWAYKGFGDHKLSALFSMGLCILGIGLYLAVFIMEWGNGKPKPGQYDYTFSKVPAAELAVLTQIAQDAGLKLQDATFTEHWNLPKPFAGFRVCVQKGQIKALNFSGKKIRDLAPFSQLPYLQDLHLNRCELSDMSALQSEILDRLEVADNQISDLKTLGGCPNLRWLIMPNNQVKSMDGIERFGKLVSQDLSGNPVLN